MTYTSLSSGSVSSLGASPRELQLSWKGSEALGSEAAARLTGASIDGTCEGAPLLGDAAFTTANPMRRESTSAESDVEGMAHEDSSQVDDDALFSKVNRRILPLFFLMVVFNFFDRTNLAFAAIQLQQDLGFGPAVYGLGSGLFFTTYATLQVPSNIILKRVGGPRWLAAIIAAWGACAVAFAFMHTTTQFYVLRTLLGLAESGAFPGMWYVLGKFYPKDRITMAFAVTESGISLSHTAAAPVAAGLLLLDGTAGLQGWQWLFLVEGIPSLLLAGAIVYLLPASLSKAKFLTPPERKYLAARLAFSTQHPDEQHDHTQLPLNGCAAACGSSCSITAGVAATAAAGAQRQPKSVSNSNEPVSSEAELLAAVLSVPVGGDDGLLAPHSHNADAQTDTELGLGLNKSKSHLLVSNTVTSRLLQHEQRDDDDDAVTHHRQHKQQAHWHGTGAANQQCQQQQQQQQRRSRGGGRFCWLDQDTQEAFRLAVRCPHVWYLACNKILKDMAGWGITFFTPMIVQALVSGQALGPTATTTNNHHNSTEGGGGGGNGNDTGHSSSERGAKAALLTSIPYALGALATFLNAHHSQHTGERVMHIGLPLLVGGLLLAAFPLMAAYSAVAGFISLCAGVVVMCCTGAPTLALLSEVAAGKGLVVALPVYNSMGQIGGFVGPYIIGLLVSATHSYAIPTTMMGLLFAASGLIQLAMPAVLPHAALQRRQLAQHRHNADARTYHDDQQKMCGEDEGEQEGWDERPLLLPQQHRISATSNDS